MADISDVLVALRDAVTAALAAALLVQPGPGHAGTRIFVGWPDPSLDADLEAGICTVSIWPRGTTREVAAYMDGWVEQPPLSSGVSIVVSGDAATLAGAVTAPGTVAAVVVNGTLAVSREALLGESAAALAAALAALVAPNRSCTASGGTLTIPGASRLDVRVLAGRIERREIRRTIQGIQITAWTPTPAKRDALIRVIDAAIHDQMRALALPDGSVATITYDGTAYDEAQRKQPLHRRDLLVSAEFAMTQQRAAPPVLVPTTLITPEPARITRTVLS